MASSTMIDYAAQYSPDSTRIAFCSNRSGYEEIWVANQDGSGSQKLTAFNGPPAGSPRWSPDGRLLAFDGSASGRWDIYVIDARGGKPRQVTDGPGNNTVPSWSADGNWVYFASNRLGRFELWKIPVRGGEAVKVTKNGGFAGAESPDGQFVYYTKADHSSSLWRMPAHGGEEAQVLPSIYARNFAIAKQGVYFMAESKSHQTELSFFEFSSGTISRLILLQRVFLGLSVSASDEQILYTQVNEPGGDLMLVSNLH